MSHEAEFALRAAWYSAVAQALPSKDALLTDALEAALTTTIRLRVESDTAMLCILGMSLSENKNKAAQRGMTDTFLTSADKVAIITADLKHMQVHMPTSSSTGICIWCSSFVTPSPLAFLSSLVSVSSRAPLFHWPTAQLAHTPPPLPAFAVQPNVGWATGCSLACERSGSSSRSRISLCAPDSPGLYWTPPSFSSSERS